MPRRVRNTVGTGRTGTIGPPDACDREPALPVVSMSDSFAGRVAAAAFIHRRSREIRAGWTATHRTTGCPARSPT